ncbi:putative motility protein [Caldichromatium japonicum]|uniref:Putative motility protein n=1 Tax=Caldichromatium japonicum TaxID=2699430 RepID=A0A6G7VAK5_9GAMM|nr:putative motility protein [Caldichromatium japonicum]QIK36982.1 putative motility protein [Caldichromatium japonicum]
MDITSTFAVHGYPNTLASTKTEASVAIEMLNKANQIQSDSAKQILQSIQPSAASTQALPDHLGRYINLTA